MAKFAVILIGIGTFCYFSLAFSKIFQGGIGKNGTTVAVSGFYFIRHCFCFCQRWVFFYQRRVFFYTRDGCSFTPEMGVLLHQRWVFSFIRDGCSLSLEMGVLFH